MLDRRRLYQQGSRCWADRHTTPLDGRPRHAVRAARVVIKDAAFGLLHDMGAVLDAVLAVLMDSHLAQLRARMAATVDEVTPALLTEDAALLAGEYHRCTANGS